MIYRLQKKFILSSAAAIFLVIVLIMTVVLIWNMATVNQTLDQLIDKASYEQLRILWILAKNIVK